MHAMTSHRTVRWLRSPRAVALAAIALLTVGVSGSTATQNDIFRTAVDLANGIHFTVITASAHPLRGRFAFTSDHVFTAAYVSA